MYNISGMADTKIESPEIEPETLEVSEDSKPNEKPGLAFFGALALVLFLVILILFTNIPGMRASAGADMTKHSWILLSYADSSGRLIPVIPEINVTAGFGNSRISGVAGCNSYSAPYTVNEYGIAVASLIKTEIGCPSGIMQVETDFLNDLQNASLFRINDNRLNFYNATGKEILIFAAE